MFDSHPPTNFLNKLKEQGFSDEIIDEIMKWYDSSKRKGVASF
jgi:hypothetical protein